VPSYRSRETSNSPIGFRAPSLASLDRKCIGFFAPLTRIDAARASARRRSTTEPVMSPNTTRAETTCTIVNQVALPSRCPEIPKLMRQMPRSIGVFRLGQSREYIDFGPPGQRRTRWESGSITLRLIDVSRPAGFRDGIASLVKAACPDALSQILPPNMVLTCPSATIAPAGVRRLRHQGRQRSRRAGHEQTTATIEAVAANDQPTILACRAGGRFHRAGWQREVSTRQPRVRIFKPRQLRPVRQVTRRVPRTIARRTSDRTRSSVFHTLYQAVVDPASQRRRLDAPSK